MVRAFFTQGSIISLKNFWDYSVFVPAKITYPLKKVRKTDLILVAFIKSLEILKQLNFAEKIDKFLLR